MTEPQDGERTFVRRTKDNLDLAEAIQDRLPEFWEVTFLVNSLLGLIVVPRQTLLDELHTLPVTRTGIPSWGVAFVIDGDPLPGDLRALIKGLRNAVAHFSLSFTTEAGEIIGLHFQTYEDERATIARWAASFKIGELRAFLDHLAEEVDIAWLRRHRREQLPLRR